MKRLKHLSKDELIRVIDLLMRHNLNGKWMLDKVLNELKYEKTMQLIDEEKAAFEEYLKARTAYQNATVEYLQKPTIASKDRDYIELKKQEKKMEAALKKYEALRDQLKTLQGV